MKRFDEQFTDRVKQAFTNYNADQLADAGWKAFQQKQGNRNRFLAAIPLWAKAASITILLAIGSYSTFILTQKPNEGILVEEKPKVQIEEKNDVFTTEPVENTSKTGIAEVKIPREKRETSESLRLINEVNEESLPIPSSDSVLLVITNPDSTIILAQVEETIPQITEVDTTAAKQSEKKDVVTNQTNPLPVVAQTLIDPIDEPSRDKKLSLSAGLSGMLARVENLVSSAPGVAIGLYAEQRLTDRISIRPGLALAKHTYGLESFSDNEDFATAPTLDGVSGEVVEYDNHLDIIAMEIPINFVFNISKKRDRTLFVSAGTSTMIYLNQHFTGSMYSRYSQDLYNEATGDWENSTSYTRVTIDNQYGAFSRTDFFGLANLSAGYAFPFGKKSTMLIEPFVQFPVSKLTSSDLKLRFGGISIKYKINR